MTYNHVNGNMRCIYTGTGHQSISMYQKNKAAEESSKQKTESESSQKLEIEARFIFYENGARSSGNQEGAMDRTRGLPTGVLCGLVWRPSMGFHSQSFRFEGGGRQIIGMVVWRWKAFARSYPFNQIYTLSWCVVLFCVCRFEQNR